MRSEVSTWFAANIPAQTDDCVIWPFGRFADGCGGLSHDGKKVRASRFVCSLIHGDAANPKMDAAHRCGRGHDACVNDRHLYWATRSKNASDRIEHGTANRGQRNGQAKLTESQAREILSLKDGGLLHKEVAAEFGISRELVGRIWRRQIWEWL